MRKPIPVLWLAKRLRHRIPALFFMSAAHVGEALLGVAFALGTRDIVDCAVARNTAAFTAACVRQLLIIAGGLLCLTLYRHLRDRLRADMERDWKSRLFGGLLHGEYGDVSAYHSGELLNRLNGDVNAVNDGVLNVLPNLAAMAVRLGAVLVVLAAMDGVFTVVVLAAGCVVIAATGLLRRRLKAMQKAVSAHNGRVSGFMQEALEKLLMVQAMDIPTEIEKRSSVLLDERYEAQRKRKNVSLAANTTVSVLSKGAAFFALVWCGVRLLHGQMSFGELTAVTQLVSQLQAPLVGLSGILPQYISMLASAERLMELEEVCGEPVVPKDRERLYGELEAICAEHLCFAYDREDVLQDGEFRLPKGAFAVVTGPSGVGKSTVLKLLLGIFRPHSGSLYLRTERGRVVIDRSTRGLFAYVPQGNLLLSGTLRENLTVVQPHASEAEIAHAVYVSAMDEFLPQLPMGLDTVLGENGVGLSEGQAQRLAIARAVLGGAPILLLDECTSALDAETEQKVLGRLRDLPDRTCIAVTHRPAVLAMCDTRLEVNSGKICVIRTEP